MYCPQQVFSIANCLKLLKLTWSFPHKKYTVLLANPCEKDEKDSQP